MDSNLNVDLQREPNPSELLLLLTAVITAHQKKLEVPEYVYSFIENLSESILIDTCKTLSASVCLMGHPDPTSDERHKIIQLRSNAEVLGKLLAQLLDSKSKIKTQGQEFIDLAFAIKQWDEEDYKLFASQSN